MYVCVDFDGTVVDHRYPQIGQPAPGAIEWLKRLQQAGVKLILFTMRSENSNNGDTLTPAVRFLEDQGINLFGVNRNPTQDSWTSSPKAYGNVYIDDAAFGAPLIHPEGFAGPCIDWSVVGPELLKRCP